LFAALKNKDRVASSSRAPISGKIEAFLSFSALV
jgi:hypothetical protein